METLLSKRNSPSLASHVSETRLQDIFFKNLKVNIQKTENYIKEELAEHTQGKGSTVVCLFICRWFNEAVSSSDRISFRLYYQWIGKDVEQSVNDLI